MKIFIELNQINKLNLLGQDINLIDLKKNDIKKGNEIIVTFGSEKIKLVL